MYEHHVPHEWCLQYIHGQVSIVYESWFSCQNSKTGGIIPVNNPLIPAIEAYNSTGYGGVYPQVTPLGGSYYRGLSPNQTLTQQDFTANVSCRPQNLSDPTSFPYTVLSSSTSNISALGSTYSITTWSWNTTCSDEVFSCKIPVDLRSFAQLFFSDDGCLYP